MPYQTGDFSVAADGRDVGSVSVSQKGLMTVFESTCEYKSADVLRLAAICNTRTVVLGVVIPDKEGVLRFKKSFSKNALAEIGFSDPTAYRLARPSELQTGSAPAQPEENADAPGMANAATDNKSAAQADGTPADTHQVPRQNPSVLRPANTPPAKVHMPPFTAGQPRQSPQPQTQAQIQQPQSQSQNNANTQSSASEAEAENNDKSNTRTEAAKPEMPDGWSPTDNPGGLFHDPDFAQICRGVKGALTKQSDEYILLAVPVSQDEPFPMMPVFCFGDSGRIDGREYIIFKIKNGKLAL